MRRRRRRKIELTISISIFISRSTVGVNCLKIRKHTFTEKKKASALFFGDNQQNKGKERAMGTHIYKKNQSTNEKKIRKNRINLKMNSLWEAMTHIMSSTGQPLSTKKDGR